MSLRVATLPRDTNHYGTIFGGVLLSYIDQAAALAARAHGRHRWVTASFDRVDFKAPVHLGDVVNFFTTTTRMGTKSVTIQVEVESERFTQAACVAVTSATVTMVAIDAHGNPIPFRTPPTVGE
jgi:acyl-CoA thioesterase YciA